MWHSEYENPISTETEMVTSQVLLMEASLYIALVTTGNKMNRMISLWVNNFRHKQVPSGPQDNSLDFTGYLWGKSVDPSSLETAYTCIIILSLHGTK